ncbi:MAG: acetyl-CoA hydrolase/transferase C-terminal domain-containing protein, partial [Clostridia bacterium]|nr:acetyl-CoA hydrolase/transferase C-terminal domain-containing protein [Clostridia bacterium]
RAGAANGIVTHAPLHLSRLGEYTEHIAPDVLVLPMTPPNEQGYCNIGPAGYAAAAIKCSKKIIAQINSHIPRVYGSTHDIHVSDIAAFVEHEDHSYMPPSAEPSETDKKIASYILERIPDGACIQLGIGGTANAVGFGLKDKKHLGVHSEMYTDSMAYLQKLGVIDNSRKTFMPGRSVAGFAFNTELTNSFINNNPKVFFEPYHVVNNIQSIAANDNMVSINTTLSVDLTGQLCSESIGMKQYSGSGGQVDYIRGATLSKGGMSFIAMSSVANTKNGPVSKICLSLAPGSIVTTLRAETMYVVTEYGCVNLQFCDVPTRAKKLISIAHPDFRDELTFEAKKYGLLY